MTAAPTGRRVGRCSDAIYPAPGSVNSRIFDTELEMFGVGIAQGIDAAAMTLYLSVSPHRRRHHCHEHDVGHRSYAERSTSTISTSSMTGGIIKF